MGKSVKSLYTPTLHLVLAFAVLSYKYLIYSKSFLPHLIFVPFLQASEDPCTHTVFQYCHRSRTHCEITVHAYKHLSWVFVCWFCWYSTTVTYQRLSPSEGSGTATIFCHVNDMGLKVNKICIPHLICALSSRFELSKGRPIYYPLGMHITQHYAKHTISFSQGAYINCILTRYWFEDIHPVTTLMDLHVLLLKEQCTIMEQQKRWWWSHTEKHSAHLGTLLLEQDQTYTQYSLWQNSFKTPVLHIGLCSNVCSHISVVRSTIHWH